MFNKSGQAEPLACVMNLFGESYTESLTYTLADHKIIQSWRGRCVCRFNSSPAGGAVSAGLTPVLEGALCLQV